MRLYQFLLDAGEQPYRELVRHHLERQSSAQLRNAAMGEVLGLPKELQPLAESYFDELNVRLLARRDFWQKSTCRDAVSAVLDLCNTHFGLSFQLPVDVAKMSGVEQELAFGLFQAATLSFAYTAVDQAGARKSQNSVNRGNRQFNGRSPSCTANRSAGPVPNMRGFRSLISAKNATSAR